MTTDMPVVTTDPELLAKLEAKIGQLGSQEVADYARSLGLTPPGDAEGVNPPIILTWPPGADLSGPGLIVWDMSPDED